MKSAYGNSAYGNSNLANYLAQKTLSAEPLELVAMLYLKAITEVREARRYLAEGNIALRSKAISKACEVIGELDASLNMEAGGDLSKRLHALYGYFLVRLLDANMQQADGPLAEVLGLLSTLTEGWQAIAKSESVHEKSPARPWDAPMEAASAGISSESHSWTL
jgi:flagellar secretion chaperone FliS